MKQTLLAVSVVALLGVASACSFINQERPNENKVAVCHKGKKTLFVPRPALGAHMNHGDTQGRCRGSR